MIVVKNSLFVTLWINTREFIMMKIYWNVDTVPEDFGLIFKGAIMNAWSIIVRRLNVRGVDVHLSLIALLLAKPISQPSTTQFHSIAINAIANISWKENLIIANGSIKLCKQEKNSSKVKTLFSEFIGLINSNVSTIALEQNQLKHSMISFFLAEHVSHPVFLDLSAFKQYSSHLETLQSLFQYLDGPLRFWYLSSIIWY